MAAWVLRLGCQSGNAGMTQSTRGLISTCCVATGLAVMAARGDGNPAHLSLIEGTGLACIVLALALRYLPARRDDA